MKYTETERLFGDNFHQHQVAALQDTDRKLHEKMERFISDRCLFRASSRLTDQDVSLVRVGLFSFFGNQQQLVEQEEGSFVFGSL